MSSRALEIVRVLCMHMGDIIFFIAYAWPTRGDTPPRTTPPAVPLDLCVILHDSPKKKGADKKMKIRCDFWPLPGSSATLIAGNKAWHTAWNTDKHVVMPHTHRDRHSLGMELYLCTYRPTEICDTHSFLKRIPHARQLAPGSISLPVLPLHALPPPLVLIFISVLRKFQPHTPYYAKCKAWRIDKINKYENLRQNFFVFWQFT